jgi:flagellar biosynthesis repressor protein FlbT
MALKISLKADERIIVGGAVLRNASKKNVEFLVENEVPLLRERELLTEAKADTPCKRIYFVIQLMYVDAQHLGQHQKLYWQITKEILEAAPSTGQYFTIISGLIQDGKYYQALKEAKKLIDYEKEVMNNALKSGRSI